MLLAIYKAIFDAFEKRFHQFAQYKTDCYPEVFNFNWGGLKEIIKTVEDDLAWDDDLRDLLVIVVTRLLQYLRDRGSLDFYTFIDVTKKFLEYYHTQSNAFALHDYMEEITVSKDQLDFFQPVLKSPA